MSAFLEFARNYTVFDSVATGVFSRPMPATSFARIYVQAAAARANGDHRSFYRSVGCLRGGGAPSLTVVTDIHAPVGTAGSSAWDLTFSVTGNDINVLVTGENDQTTLWELKIIVIFLRDD